MNWQYTLKQGPALRAAIQSEDFGETLHQIELCYDELLDAGLIDEWDHERWTEDLSFYDVEDDDPEELEDSINYELDNLFDLCDNIRVWVGIDW